jgi:glycyl-tRNA synthetase beta chain
MSAPSLTVELLTEELPPKALARLGAAFAEILFAGLSSRGLLLPTSAKTSYATPRRLAVKITDVLPVAPDSEVIDKLMPAKVAFAANGEPTEALRKKLSALGRAHLATAGQDARDGTDHRYTASDGKADYVYLRSLAKGQPLERGLEEALDEAITGLPIPKVMTYQLGNGESVKFVRPAHGLLALHGVDVVPVHALGLDAGRVTAGHRFLSRPDLTVESADAYEETLRAEGKVIASFAERRGRIATLLQEASRGVAVVMPDALLDEVTALVEMPAVYEGTFDPAFLSVPQECLILTMQQNQKYFAVADASGKLLPRFLLVSNLPTEAPAAIIAGNERVLRARLADARFFFDQDRKVPLEARLPKLAAVVYHNKLGTQAERVARLRRLASEIAEAIGADRAATERAATLAKCDLVTDMVGEFPELQGLMGALLRAARRRNGRGRASDRAALLAALRGRRAAAGQGCASARARRQARDACRHVRHRRASFRRQGSVRTAPACDRRDSHPGRRKFAAQALGTRRSFFRRVRQSRRRATGGRGIASLHL